MPVSHDESSSPPTGTVSVAGQIPTAITSYTAPIGEDIDLVILPARPGVTLSQRSGAVETPPIVTSY